MLPVLAAGGGGALAALGTLTGLVGAVVIQAVRFIFFQKLLRYAWILAYAAAALAVYFGAYVLINSLLFLIITPIDNPYLRMGFYMVWPPGADVLIAAYFSARFVLWAARFKMALMAAAI